MTKFDIVKRKAQALGATKVGRSMVGKKKYYVIYNGKTIHFGHKDYQDFLDHKDDKRRENYLKRAKGITDKSGRYTWKDKTKPNFWAVHVLW